MIEAILNVIAFPLGAVGQVSNFDFYQGTEYVRNILFYKIYTLSPYLYAFMFIVLWGVIAGVLAMFTMAISTFSFMRYWLLLFIPVYLIFYMTHSLKELFNMNFFTTYIFYMEIFDEAVKSEVALLVSVFTLLVISMLIVTWRSNQDALR